MYLILLVLLTTAWAGHLGASADFQTATYTQTPYGSMRIVKDMTLTWLVRASAPKLQLLPM